MLTPRQIITDDMVERLLAPGEDQPETSEAEVIAKARELEFMFSPTPFKVSVDGISRLALLPAIPLGLEEEVSYRTYDEGDTNYKKAILGSIIKNVADHYGVKPEEIVGDRRTRGILLPRQIAMYIAKQYTGLSYPKIGQIFNRDHSTVMFAKKAVDNLLREKPHLAVDIEEIAQQSLRVAQIKSNSNLRAVILTANGLYLCDPFALTTREKQILGVDIDSGLLWTGREIDSHLKQIYLPIAWALLRQKEQEKLNKDLQFVGEA